MVSGRDSVIELQLCLTLEDVASFLAYPELEEISIARGICPSEYAGSCHTLGCQTCRTVSHDYNQRCRQADRPSTKGSINASV